MFTEFRLSNRQRADIAIVRLLPRRQMETPWYDISDRVEETLAIIECKLKSGRVNLDPFQHDVDKIRHLTRLSSYKKSLFYLAFIHEAAFEPVNLSMLSERQKASWALGRVAELVGCFVTGERRMHFELISHNGLNPGTGQNVASDDPEKMPVLSE